jgi:hypothetical protein
MLSRWADTLALLIRIERLGRQARISNLSQRAIPTSRTKSRWSRSLRRLSRLRTPLRSGRAMDRGWLIRLRVNVLRYRSVALVRGTCWSLTVLKELQTSLDVDIGRVEISRTLVRVQCVGSLIVARLVQGSQIVPDLWNVGVQTDSTRVRIKRISVLVDLVIQHSYAAPECGIAPVAVNSLLVRLVRLGVLLLGHVASSKEVPTLRVGLVRVYWLLQIFNGLLLTGVVGALLVVQPSKLLENLRVVGIAFKHATVGALRSFELLLLLVDVTDLEPNILFRERTRGVGDYVFEALVCR